MLPSWGHYVFTKVTKLTVYSRLETRIRCYYYCNYHHRFLSQLVTGLTLSRGPNFWLKFLSPNIASNSSLNPEIPHQLPCTFLAPGIEYWSYCLKNTWKEMWRNCSKPRACWSASISIIWNDPYLPFMFPNRKVRLNHPTQATRGMKTQRKTHVSGRF